MQQFSQKPVVAISIIRKIPAAINHKYHIKISSKNNYTIKSMKMEEICFKFYIKTIQKSS